MSMKSVQDWYARRIFQNMPVLLEQFDAVHGSFGPASHRNQHCLRAFAWFYKNQWPGNPVFGDRSVLEKVIRAGDTLVASEKPGRHGGTLGGEWPPYNLIECIDWLGAELGAERIARWRAALERHLARIQITSNYIATAPNHYSWRAAVLARAGKLFGREDWLRAAARLARQIGVMQTPDGYWDEAHRGHGPSPNYHRVHLHGLDLYYRNSGDAAVLETLARATQFATRAAWPDGSPVETFDGRQPYLAAFAVGMAANAFTRTAEGRRLLALQCELADRVGIADARHPTGFALTWYAFATTDFMIDCFRFVAEESAGGRVIAEEAARLPSEREGHLDRFVINKQVGETGAVLLRKGAWTAAVAAIDSDVPRFIQNVYISERQTGFSLLHARAGLVVGGGNRMRNHAPLVNAVVLTGWEDVDCVAGVFKAPYLDDGEKAAAGQTVTEQAPFVSAALPRPGHEGIDPVKCCYHPIRRTVDAAEGAGRATLTLEFMHGTVVFELTPVDDRRFRIACRYDLVGVKNLLLQVPVVLFHPGRFAIDGAAQAVGDLEAVQSLPLGRELTLRARDTTVAFRLPKRGSEAGPGGAQFTYPLEPIKNTQLKRMNYVPDPRYRPLYTVGLISQTLTTADPVGAPLKGALELLTVECG
ncbi:MAG TPA: hypothetical protein VL860_07195 [Planctomycetota bacterium]|nr:hypothetical protein [Planctomycetota bacterium]